MNVNRMLSILLERMHDLVTSVDGQVSRYVMIVHVGGTRCVTWSIDRIIQIHARITWGVVLILAIFFIFFLYVWLPLPIRSIVRLLFNVWLRRVQLWSVYPRSMSTTVSGVMKTFVAVKQTLFFEFLISEGLLSIFDWLFSIISVTLGISKGPTKRGRRHAHLFVLGPSGRGRRSAALLFSILGVHPQR